MHEISFRVFAVALAGLLALQFVAGLWHISDPFIDGRLHYNWGPPFWLMKAQETNDIGLSGAYFGVAEYRSHPQLIGPVIALWTRAAGYSEASIRLLSLSLTVLSTLIFALAIRHFTDNRRALAFALLFAALPLVYIYGKKLDQEALVLLFLAIHLWGIGLLTQSSRAGLVVAGIGSLGMVLSDWSGLLLAFAAGAVAPFAWGWKEHKQRVISFVAVSYTAAAVGLGLFLLQGYLQAGSPGLGALVAEYAGLWRYRAGGTASDVVWYKWLSTQLGFLSRNFTIPLALAGLSGLVLMLSKGIRVHDGRAWTAAVFVCGITIGHVAYMLAVPQASGVHIYYQYFLAVAIAFGLVYLVDRFAEKLSPRSTKYTWAAVLLCVVLGTAASSIYQYHKLLVKDTAGDASDIALVRRVRDLPVGVLVIGIASNRTAASWFENKNIEYYAGRAIQGHDFTRVPYADYQIVPVSYSAQILDAINTNALYGPGVTGTQVHCSTNFCLLELELEGR